MIRILIVVPSFPKISGVDYHRLVIPHDFISNEYKDQVEISQINEIDSKDIDFLSQFDLVVANRFISKTGAINEVISKLKEANIPYVLDMDDDYILHDSHILKTAVKQYNHATQIALSIKGATAITTTQELLANTIEKELNQKNIYIVPNGINPIKQFADKIYPNNGKVNFGWSGSITHFDDVLLMHDALLALYKSPDYANKIKMVYGGHAPHNGTSNAILGVLTCKGIANKEQFATFPEATVFEYAKFYDTIDIALIPLRNNRFNNNKSNLKLQEAAFKGKAVICSDVYPYSPDLKHGKNCLIVKHKNDWYKNMTKLIDNPNLRNDLAAQLSEDMQKYHIKNVAKSRFEAYKQILNI